MGWSSVFHNTFNVTVPNLNGYWVLSENMLVCRWEEGLFYALAASQPCALSANSLPSRVTSCLPSVSVVM